MTTNNRFTQALFEQKRKTEQRNPLIAGSLGITMNGQTLVEVPDRASYVYVQVRSSTAEVIQAFNQTVSPVYGLPVFIQWEGNRYVVVERDTMRYSNWIDNSSYLPRHASTHEWSGSAGDVVFSSQQQFLPLMPMPSGSAGNGSIVVNDYNLMATGGNFLYFPGQASVNMTVWNPSSSTGAIMALVMLDASNGQLAYAVNSGTVFGNWLTGTADVLPKVPIVSDQGRFLPIAAVRLITGTRQITWDNIYDVRPLFGTTRGSRTAGGGAGGGGTSNGILAMYGGVLLGTGTYINWHGAGVIVTLSGTIIDVLESGGGGGTGSNFLALDTSNGPLVGPLVVKQNNPAVINQYFDYSTIVGYLSGTPGLQFGAGVEAVNFSTGSRAYTIYADDEGSGLALFAGASVAMDQGPMVEFSHFIDGNKVGGRYFQNIIQSTRNGGGFPATTYIGNHFTLNERDTAHIHGPSIEVQANFNPVTDIFPMATGRALAGGYPFPGQGDAAYGWDTFNDLVAIITGTTHTLWANQGVIQAWLTPNGELAIKQLRVREYAPAFGTPPISGSFSQGAVNLVNGTATIKTTAVTMSSRIYLTTQFGSGAHVGYNYVYSRGAGSGFTIRSSDLLDTSLVAWLLVEPT